MSQNKSINGFTMVEILVVLLIFMIIQFIGWAAIPTARVKDRAEPFMKQLENDLYYIQQYAISHNISLYFTMNTQMGKYYAGSEESGVLLLRDIPANIKVEKGSLDLNFYIRPNGNSSKVGNWYIQTDKQLFEFVLLIGKGRFYYIEQKRIDSR